MNLEPPPLSPRLAAVAAAIAPGSRVADVGADHGKLPLWLAANGRVAFCLVTEKSPAILARTMRAPEGAPWARLLAYRAGDGLMAIRAADRIDTVVLAGMGGRSIVRLLDAYAASVPGLSRLVLQPRSEAQIPRRWLSEHGWRPVSERLTLDRGRYHPTLAAEPGGDADLYSHPVLTRDDLLQAGPLLTRSDSPDVARFWRLEKSRLAGILGGLAGGRSQAVLRAGLARSERVLEAISPRGE